MSLCGASIVAAVEILNAIMPSSGGQTSLVILSVIAGFLTGLTMETGSDKLAAGIVGPIFSVVIYWIIILLPVELGLAPAYAVSLILDTAFLEGFFNGLLSFIPFFAGCLATLLVSS